ncbi:MAG: pre-peptidase C-terminal domain-containing protein, partial [Gemmatimonadota bacterium]
AGFTGNSGAAILSTPAVLDFPATLSSATANTFPAQDTITLTAGAGFKILPSATVSTGGANALVLSIAADSSAISFIPVPGSGTGPVTVNDIALSFLTGVALSLPSQPALAVGAGGGDAFATAPTLAIPAAGITAMYYDAGPFVTGAPVCSNSLGGPCRMYQFTIAASQSITFSASWDNTTDLGIYFSTTGSNIVNTTGCDSHGNGANGQPETCTGTFTAGTYYVIVDSFAPFYSAPDDVDPSSFTLSITGN